jgi:F420H(2)-dependent quinone reductase
MEKSHPIATHERTVRGRHFSDWFIAGALRIFSRVHITLYHLTGGIIGGRIFGNRMLLLTTAGRKTGQARTKPVGYLTDGGAWSLSPERLERRSNPTGGSTWSFWDEEIEP